MGIYAVDKLMKEARTLAAQYRKATGKPLGISSEIAEYDAARLLNLELCADRSGGFDAIGAGKREGRRVQIKGRAIFDERKSGHRIGQLKCDKPWDSVVLVIMNSEYEPVEIYEASRDVIDEAMVASQSKRANRGAMTVAKFKVISELVWSVETGITDEVWDNQADE